MAQKVTGIIKLQINAAKATASPPAGPEGRWFGECLRRPQQAEGWFSDRRSGH